MIERKYEIESRQEYFVLTNYYVRSSEHRFFYADYLKVCGSEFIEPLDILMIENTTCKVMKIDNRLNNSIL